jgi:hypothetical protein
MLMSASTAVWLIYDMATATEVPRAAAAYMQYTFLAMAVLGFFGSLLNYAAEKRTSLRRRLLNCALASIG